MRKICRSSNTSPTSALIGVGRGEVAADRLLEHDAGVRRDHADRPSLRQTGPNRSGAVAR